MTKDVQDYRSVADSYAGFVSEDKIYLLRVVQCRPGSVNDYVERFGASIDSLAELSPSLVPVGAWRTVYGQSDEVTHIHEFGGLADLQDDLDLLQREADDPATRSLFDSQDSRTSKVLRSLSYRLALRGSGRELYVSRTSKVLRSLPYCPEVLVTDAENADSSRRICLMVNVHCTRAGMGDFVSHFGSGIENRRKLDPSLVPVGAWRTIYGGRYYVVHHVYSFDSLADVERTRRILYLDETFQAHIKTNTSPVPPNFWEWGGFSKLLKPLPYSRMP